MQFSLTPVLELFTELIYAVVIPVWATIHERLDWDQPNSSDSCFITHRKLDLKD